MWMRSRGPWLRIQQGDRAAFLFCFTQVPFDGFRLIAEGAQKPKKVRKLHKLSPPTAKDHGSTLLGGWAPNWGVLGRGRAFFGVGKMGLG